MTDEQQLAIMKRMREGNSLDVSNPVLETLVSRNLIKSYVLTNLDSYGNTIEDIDDEYRCTQRCIINFLDGTNLCIDTFCSGNMENTSLHFMEIHK